MKKTIATLALLALTACPFPVVPENPPVATCGGMVFGDPIIWTYDVFADGSVVASAGSFTTEGAGCWPIDTSNTFQCPVTVPMDACGSSNKSLSFAFDPVTAQVEITFDGAACGPAIRFTVPCE
jgi:hypothetical protein